MLLFTLVGEGKTTRKMNICKCKSGHSANRLRSAFDP